MEVVDGDMITCVNTPGWLQQAGGAAGCYVAGFEYPFCSKWWAVRINRPIPHKLIGWANYFLLKCWGKNHDVMLPFKHCFNGKSVQF